MKNQIAVFIKQYNIEYSTSILCLLEFLLEHYRLILYIDSVKVGQSEMIKNKNLRIVDLKLKVDLIIRVLRKTSEYIRFVRHFVPVYEKLKQKWKMYRISRKRFFAHITIEPHAFVLCKDLFPKSRPLYYSLELYLKEDHYGLPYNEVIHNKEIENVNSIKALLIQSSERDAIFRKEYRLSAEIPSLYLPVTYKWKSNPEKTNYLRTKYQIPENKRIVLHLGGIQDYYACLEIAEAFSKINDYVLIFHGPHWGSYIEKLHSYIRSKKICNIIISSDIFDRIEDIDVIVNSADIGIAWYKDISVNFNTAGKSSGKISAYYCYGLPVIGNYSISTFDAIESVGCGYCVNDFNEIENALAKIETNYSILSENALREYDKTYWFGNYKSSLLKLFEE
jgi:hypothetical protein